MSIHPVELLWIGINGFAFLLTAVALIDALQLPELEPGARKLVAHGNIRREFLRLVMQALLLTIVVPGLFSDRPINLSPALLVVIAIPVVLLVSTVFDARDRRKLRLMAFDVIRAEQATTLERIEAAVADTKAAVADTKAAVGKVGKDAKAAYDVANNLNLKLERQGDALVQQGEDRARRETGTT